MNTKSTRQALCGADLERWRVENGLTTDAAADAFGLQKAKWHELTAPKNAAKPIRDPVVAMLLFLYSEHPEAAPLSPRVDVREFYDFLGLRDVPQDRESFATLIGRSHSSAYRLLLHDGKPGRPLIRWIEAIRRLRVSPKQSLKLMADVASSVGERQQNEKVLIHGWTRQGESSEGE
jgi:hypothetical protein